MNKKSHEVGFDEEPSIRGLHKDLPAHPANLRRKTLLVAPSSDMLDHAVGECDIKALICKFHVPPIALLINDAACCWLAGCRIHVEACDGRKYPGILPIAHVATH